MRWLSFLPVLLAACGATEESLPSGPPAAIDLKIDRAQTDGLGFPNLWLERLDSPGATAALHGDFRAGNELVTIPDLEPGTYELSCRIPLRLNGPWFTQQMQVELNSGDYDCIEFAIPEGDATLRIETESGTPPFLLALCEPDAELPASRQGLMENEGDVKRQFRFSLQSDGKSRLNDLPLVPEGEYVLYVVAIEWQTGDPPIVPRTLALTLDAGETTTVRIQDQLTKLSAE